MLGGGVVFKVSVCKGGWGVGGRNSRNTCALNCGGGGCVPWSTCMCVFVFGRPSRWRLLHDYHWQPRGNELSGAQTSFITPITTITPPHGKCINTAVPNNRCWHKTCIFSLVWTWLWSWILGHTLKLTCIYIPIRTGSVLWLLIILVVLCHCQWTTYWIIYIGRQLWITYLVLVYLNSYLKLFACYLFWIDNPKAKKIILTFAFFSLCVSITAKLSGHTGFVTK